MSVTPIRALYFAGFGNVPELHAQVVKEAFPTITPTHFHAVPYWEPDYTDGFLESRVKQRARDLANIARSDRILLIGSSMGGRIATEMALELRAAGRKVALILLSPIASASDVSLLYRRFRFTPAAVMAVVMKYAGARWLSGLDPAERPRVKLYYDACDAIPWRIKQQQLEYIARAAAPIRGSLAGIYTFAMYVTQDPIVRASSMPQYLGAGKRVTICIVKAEGHIDLVEKPQVWAKRLAPAADWLHSLGLNK